MDGGCHVLDCNKDKLLAGGPSAECRSITTLTEHKTMAYGADWLICPPAVSGFTPSETALSCSFYDRALFYGMPLVDGLRGVCDVASLRDMVL